MKISTLIYTLKQGIKGIFRNKWFSLASIATITTCLFLFGILYAVVMNFQHIVKTAQGNMSVTVFFYEETTDARIAEIGDLIRIRDEVADVKYTSGEEAWAYVQETYFNGEAEGFPTNPLEHHDNYEIFLKDVAKQSTLVTYLESIEDIRLINYQESTAEALSGVNMIIAYVALGLVVILLAVSVFLISNMVTIGISVRQEEIGIMKYIGATDFFVRAPFVIEGMIIGAIGSVIPLAIIYFAYTKVITYVLEEFGFLSHILNFLSVKEIFTVLVPVSLVIGIGIGFFGSFHTVRKHLRV